MVGNHLLPWSVVLEKRVDILGEVEHDDDHHQQADGGYKCQIFWVADPLDDNGKQALDTKNPDKSLRSVPMDKVVLFSGLKYNAEKKHWSDTKIYDPNRGIKVKVTINFDNPKVLKVRGTVLGIGETVTWNRL